MEELLIQSLNGAVPIFVIASFVFIITFLAIMVDLATGLRKAKINSQLHTSEAYRRTITKITIYEGGVILCFMGDIMLHFMFIVFNKTGWFSFVMPEGFAAFTLFFGMYVVSVEFMSVCENADKKFIKQAKNLTKLVKNICKVVGSDAVKKVLAEIEKEEEKEKERKKKGSPGEAKME